MNKTVFIRSLFPAIILLNLFALVFAFIGPRMDYIFSHWTMNEEQLLETPGPKDMPSSLSASFSLAQRIKVSSPEDATIFMPPLDNQHASPTVLKLYPRKVFWGKTSLYEKNLRIPKQNSFLVIRPGWKEKDCQNKPTIPLNGSGYKMCRLH